MKKNLLNIPFLPYLLLFISCNGYDSKKNLSFQDIIVFDQCQYLKTPGGCFVHKGNCSNPEHQQQKTTIYDTITVYNRKN